MVKRIFLLCTAVLVLGCSSESGYRIVDRQGINEQWRIELFPETRDLDSRIVGRAHYTTADLSVSFPIEVRVWFESEEDANEGSYRELSASNRNIEVEGSDGEIYYGSLFLSAQDDLYHEVDESHPASQYSTRNRMAIGSLYAKLSNADDNSVNSVLPGAISIRGPGNGFLVRL